MAKISALSAVTSLLSTDEFVLSRSGTSKKITAANGLGILQSYALYQDQQAANTAGGSTSTGSWIARTLNTEVFDPDSIGTLGSNQVTLGAGIYLLEAHSVFGAQGNFDPTTTLRIRDVTNGATVPGAISGPQRLGAASGVVDDGQILLCRGRISIAGSTVFEVQYRTTIAVATIGLGWAANVGENEVYTSLYIEKVLR